MKRKFIEQLLIKNQLIQGIISQKNYDTYAISIASSCQGVNVEDFLNFFEILYVPFQFIPVLFILASYLVFLILVCGSLQLGKKMIFSLEGLSENF